MANNVKKAENVAFATRVKSKFNELKGTKFNTQDDLYVALCEELSKDDEEYTFSKDTFNSHLSGRAKPGDFKTLVAYSNVLNTSLDYLIKGEERKPTIVEVNPFEDISAKTVFDSLFYLICCFNNPDDRYNGNVIKDVTFEVLGRFEEYPEFYEEHCKALVIMDEKVQTFLSQIMDDKQLTLYQNILDSLGKDDENVYEFLIDMFSNNMVVENHSIKKQSKMRILEEELPF